MSRTTKSEEKVEIDADQKMEETLQDWRQLKTHLNKNKEVTI
nr:hypothetical protein [uncultured Methanobacterium sp.]